MSLATAVSSSATEGDNSPKFRTIWSKEEIAKFVNIICIDQLKKNKDGAFIIMGMARRKYNKKLPKTMYLYGRDICSKPSPPDFEY